MRNDKKYTVDYNRKTIVIPALVMIVGIALYIIGLFMDANDTQWLVEIFKGFGIDMAVGSAVVLCNYLIMGIEVQNQSLSDETYEKIKEIIRDDNEEIIARVNDRNELSPTHTFKACDEPNEVFNVIVNKKLLDSAEYTYFGDSSSYFIARLKSLGGDPQKQINVFIPDYRIEEIFTSHILELRKRFVENSNDTTESAIVKARVRILQNMYCLKELMQLYNVTVYLHKETPFLRFELARPKNYGYKEDDFLALSFLPIDVNQKRFPPSFFYTNHTCIGCFNGYVDELKSRSECFDEQALNKFDFIGAVKSVDSSLCGKEDKKIISNIFEKYYANLPKVVTK